jgi:hypothetical protein
MTPGLFFTPTYDPTVNFPFNFLKFHLDALICHLLFSRFILTHSFAIEVEGILKLLLPFVTSNKSYN